MAGEREYAEAMALTPEDAPIISRLMRAQECLKRQAELWKAIWGYSKTIIAGQRGQETLSALHRVEAELREETWRIFTVPVRQGHHLDDDKSSKKGEAT